jgi:hypothetical protein
MDEDSHSLHLKNSTGPFITQANNTQSAGESIVKLLEVIDIDIIFFVTIPAEASSRLNNIVVPILAVAAVAVVAVVITWLVKKKPCSQNHLKSGPV